MEEKIFVIFNTGCIKYVLATNTLVQNIKLYYPEAKIVFVCNKQTFDAAKYQTCVNDTIVYDDMKQNNFKSIINFALNFPYKKPFASFVTDSGIKNLLISRLIGTKHIISNNKFILLNTDEKYELRNYVHIKDKLAGMIEALTNQHKNLPIRYLPPEINNALIQKIKEIQKPVLLTVTSNNENRIMPLNDCAELLNLLSAEGFTPIFAGESSIAKEYANNLKKAGCLNFIDIVDCTTFTEFANIMKICGSCISVNNGALQLANALQIPVVGIFYDNSADIWKSDTNLYPAKTIGDEHNTPINIIQAYKELIGLGK